MLTSSVEIPSIVQQTPATVVSLALSRTHIHTHIHKQAKTLCLSLCLSLSLSLSHTLSHTHTHTLSHSGVGVREAGTSEVLMPRLTGGRPAEAASWSRGTASGPPCLHTALQYLKSKFDTLILEN